MKKISFKKIFVKNIQYMITGAESGDMSLSPSSPGYYSPGGLTAGRGRLPYLQVNFPRYF